MQGRTEKFLLDNNCRIAKKARRKTVQIDTAVEMIGDQVKDPEIRAYAKKENYVVVTKDKKFISECVKQRIPVALYFNGYAFLITAKRIDLLGKEARDAGKIPK
jgi:rRNA-processing protein FCF1